MSSFRQRQILPCLIIVAAVVLPLIVSSNPYLIGLLVSGLTIAGIALAWALLGNLGGMVSFGHAAFFGVGSYTTALLTMDAGWPVLLAIPAGGIAATIAALIMLPAIRLSGAYFALAILAYSQIFRILATELSDLTGGASGIASIPRLPTIFGIDLAERYSTYLLLLAIVVAFTAIYAWIRKSHVGIALKAIAGSEDATRVVGVNAFALKSWMLILSAFMTGIIGAMNAHIIGFLEPDYAFSGSWSLLPIVAAIFGGYRTLWGPVCGAVIIYLFDQLVAKSLMPVGHQMLLGVLLAGTILLVPLGLMSLFDRKEGRHA